MNLALAIPREPDPEPAALPPLMEEALQTRIEGRELKLPLLPAVPMEVSRVAGSDDGDAKEIAELIQRDQAMAAHLLKLANSALYRGKVPMVTVQQAVARLGRTRVREAAIMIACEAGVFRVQGYEADVRDQFRHSVAAALFAQEIARQRRSNVEEAFLAGLMHDVGRPVLLQTLVDLQKELNCSVEREAMLDAITRYHAQVGGQLGRTWDMSARVSDCMEQHHDAEPLPSCSELVWTVQLADALSHHVFDAENFPEQTVTEHPALAALEIYPDTVQKLFARREDIHETAMAVG